MRKDETVWKNIYPEGTVPIFKGKKVKHSSDLIGALAILGPCSLKECAKKVFKISKNTPKNARVMENNFRNLCNDAMRDGQSYVGLVSSGYIFKSGEEGRFSNYALTLKGCLLALGYEFDEEDLRSFIKQSAKTHLFFAFLNRILEKTSLSFVKEIFVCPIREIIRRGKITLDDDIRFYFSNIAEACGRALYQKLDPVMEDYYPKFITGKTKDPIEIIHSQFNYVFVLRDNTFFYVNPPKDWFESIIEYFYDDNEQAKFYESHPKDLSLYLERTLIYKVMREIHNVYFWVQGIPSPKYTNKLPHSKSMKEHIKYKKQYSSTGKSCFSSIW